MRPSVIVPPARLEGLKRLIENRTELTNEIEALDEELKEQCEKLAEAEERLKNTNLELNMENIYTYVEKISSHDFDRQPSDDEPLEGWRLANKWTGNGYECGMEHEGKAVELLDYLRGEFERLTAELGSRLSAIVEEGTTIRDRFVTLSKFA